MQPKILLTKSSSASRSFKAVQRSVWLIPTLALVTAGQVRAANGTWLNTGATNGSWGTSSNWASGTIPGNTTSGATVSTDTATFNTAVGTFGTSGSPITIDSGRTISGITFDTSSVGAYTIGTVGTGTLYLSSGGTTQMTATAIASNETINAPLAIGTGSTAATYTIQNNSTSTGILTIGGTISGTTTSTVGLTLAGSNTGANVVSGNISNGSSSALAVTKSGVGTWTLSGLDSYTGATTVSAGTLALTGTLSGATAITVNGGTLTESNSGVIGSAAASLSVGGTTGSSATLSGFNTYTGATTLNAGGSLTLDFSQATSPSSAVNILNHSANTGSLVLSGGTFAIKGGRIERDEFAATQRP